MNDFHIPSAVSGCYPVRSGNALRPLIDGEPAFRQICKAIETARESVWATVTFMWADFQMPDGRGSALEFLSRAAARGLDIRLIFWRPDAATKRLEANAFWGSPAHLRQLESVHPTVRIRWDRAHPDFCQHQKCWLIDAGAEAQTSFVGGINLNPHSMVSRGHGGEGPQNHDVYMELVGPSVVDIHHNFVQRWNEASERHAVDGRWGLGSDTDLPFPTRVPACTGDAVVQIQRTIHSGRYRDRQATPGGVSFDIEAGERSNFEQYCAAFAAARRWIYIENQHVDVPEILACLRQALQRGIEVVLVVPAEAAMPQELTALAAYDTFTLAALEDLGNDGRRKPVWVHSKLMIVDGEWGTVGSCNLHRFSLFGNSELNVAFWDRKAAQTLLSELLREHLGEDISGMDGLAALRLFRLIATANGDAYKSGEATWQGIAFRRDF